MRRLLGFGLLWVLAFSACTSGGSRQGTNANQSDGTPQIEVQTSPTTRQARPVGASTGEATTFFDGRHMSVRLRVTPSRVAQGEAPEAVLISTGEGELGYSFGFKIERKVDHKWRWINKHQAFPRPLFYLATGERSEPESLAVYFDEPEPVGLGPGLYRVTKIVVLAPGQSRPPTMKVSARFRVIPR